MHESHPRESILYLVAGKSFLGISEPKLRITMIHTVNNGTERVVTTTVFESACERQTDSTMVCPYPRLVVPPQFLNTREDSGETLEGQKANGTNTTNGADFKLVIDGQRLDFHLGFSLDGDATYHNLTQSLPHQSALVIYGEPPRFDGIGRVLFTAGLVLTLPGRWLRRAGHTAADYRVLLGTDAGVCRVTALTDSALVCEPPPPAAGRHGAHNITVMRGANLEPVHVGEWGDSNMYANAQYQQVLALKIAIFPKMSFVLRWDSNPQPVC